MNATITGISTTNNSMTNNALTALECLLSKLLYKK